MTSAAETPIDAALNGTLPTAGTVTPLPGGRLAVRDGDRLETHEAAALLAGELSPLHTLRLPEQAAAAALDDGAIVAEAGRIRRVTADGTTVWELPHAPWHGPHQTPRPPGPPAVHPGGGLVSAVVPNLGTGRRTGRGAASTPPYKSDVLILADVGTGDIRAQRPIGGISSVITQRWHPGGGLLAVSRWTAWYSWSSWWIEPRHDGLHIRGGTTMREIIDFLPGAPADRPRALTLRRAERIAANDDRDELACHEVTADEPAVLYDLAGLGADRDDDEFDGAFLLDGRHLLVTGRIHAPGRPAAARHWLCDAATLRPLGRIRYPAPVGWVTPLGDGTWLTRSTRGLHHWRLP
ncbi:hypothetical protein [Streptomyces sp. CAU 1734]|uniref:hypothetical protein n=1 Tax=Streptomyces sp. CAU 1734 TaxID=3140360 RepID=UPI0032602CB5